MAANEEPSAADGEGERMPNYIDASRPELGERVRYSVGAEDLERDPSREADGGAVPGGGGTVAAMQRGAEEPRPSAFGGGGMENPPLPS